MTVVRDVNPLSGPVENRARRSFQGAGSKCILYGQTLFFQADASSPVETGNVKRGMPKGNPPAPSAFDTRLLPMSGNVIRGKLERKANEGSLSLMSAPVLLEFSEAMAMAGAARLFGKGHRITVNSNLSILGTTRSTALSGRCILSGAVAGLVVCEVEITDGESKRVALATLGLAPVPSEEPGAADARETPPPEHVSKPADAATPADATSTSAIRRNQIFEAAKRIIIEKGFERATTREIAEEAGLRIPTMYQYFKTKDDLLVMIFDTYLARMESDLRAAIRGKVSATEQISAAISATLRSLDHHRREILLMTQETKSLPAEVRSAVIAKLLRYLDIFTAIIDKGVDSGEFRNINPQLYGNLIPMMCQVWAQRHWAVAHFGIDDLEKAILELTLLGIAKGTPELAGKAPLMAAD